MRTLACLPPTAPSVAATIRAPTFHHNASECTPCLGCLCWYPGPHTTSIVHASVFHLRLFSPAEDERTHRGYLFTNWSLPRQLAAHDFRVTHFRSEHAEPELHH